MSPKEMNDRLFKSRRFKILDEIGRSTQQHLSEHIERWNLDGREPITLSIDSSGGNLFAARIMADAVRFSESPVHGIVVGAAFSGAFVILQSCHRRLAYPSARLMFHYGRFEVDFDRDLNPEKTLREGVGILDEFMRSLATMSGESLKAIKKQARAADKFGAEEALKRNFLDEILIPPSR